MIYPRLYEKTETAFRSLGIGELSEAENCTVIEQLNGSYTLEMKYPENGRLFSEIKNDRWILVQPNQTADPQPFKIYNTEGNSDGSITVYGRHACYMGNGIPVAPFSAQGIGNTLNGLKSHCLVTCPLTFETDISNESSSFTLDKPKYLKSCLGGEKGSVLDVFGGEYEYDKFNVILHKHRGSDNGVSIEYGKNIIDLKQEESIEETYTGAVAFWSGNVNGETATVTGDVVKGSDTSKNKILIIDASSEFESQPTKDQLTKYAQNYYNSNNIGVPKVNLTVSFVALWQTEEYKDIAPLESVSLGDTVHVKYPELCVTATARVIKTEYDVLMNRYSSIELGDAKSTLSDTIKSVVTPSIDDEIKKNRAFFDAAIDHATELIKGGLGGHLVIGTDDDGQPNELLIMDTADKSTAKNVLRLNMNGIGFSTSGYSGPFTTAWTIGGNFNANYIAGLTIQAVKIIGGSINIGNGRFTVDSSGNMSCNNATVNGTIYGDIGSSGLDCSDGFIQASELRDSNGKVMLSTKSDGIEINAYYNGHSATVLTTGEMNSTTPCVILSNTTTSGIPVISNGTSHAFTIDWDGSNIIIKVEGSNQVKIGAGSYTTHKLRPLYRLINSNGEHMVSNQTSEGDYSNDGLLGYVYDSNG